jgi:hypothetical protein
MIPWTHTRLLVKVLTIAAFVAGSARADEVFEYQLTTQLPTVFQVSQEFYNSNPSEIHGRFGQGPDSNWALTTQPGTVRFYVDEQHNQLTRLQIVNFEANLLSTPQPGDQVPNDFNHIRMNLNIDLHSFPTSLVLSNTGGLSAQVTGNIGNVGTLVATSTKFGNQATFDVGMMSGALLGNFASSAGMPSAFEPGLNGTLRPFFSTWLTIDGTYVSPVSQQLVDYHGVFDMNGYLNFMSAAQAPVPEPDTLVLLGVGTILIVGYYSKRRRKWRRAS